ncbi:hypothetical protein [Gemmata sp.]|uniref:hypothetical protein n=1 Tax=Gemmata sp. TaxID=1914242 RepID=UPI003F70E118
MRQLVNRPAASLRSHLCVEPLDSRLTPATFAVGAADGSVSLLDSATGAAVVEDFRPFDTDAGQYTGLVSVALGDFDKDGTADVFVAAAQPGGVKGLDASKAGKVFVFDGEALQSGTATVLHTFTPFAQSDGPGGSPDPYRNGLNIAVGDVNGDATIDLVAGTRGGGAAGGLPEYGRLVVVSAGADPGGSGDTRIGSLLTPFGATYQKGVVVEAGDFNKDNRAEVAVTRGGPVGASNPNKSVKLKVFTLAGSALAELDLTGDGTPFAPFGSVTGAGGKTIERDARIAVVDTDADGFKELVFTAVDRVTDPSNPQVRIGVYAINTATGLATLASTGPTGTFTTFLTGSQVADHATTHIDTSDGGGFVNLALLTQGTGGAFAVQFLDPIIGDTITGGFGLNLALGGITLDAV